MQLVIVSGPPASGKSSVGAEIAKRLQYTYVSKDNIKERLFETESASTHRYFWYDNKARRLFFERIGQAIADNQSIVIENNFTSRDRARLRTYKKPGVHMVELFCYAKGSTMLKRYIKRNESGQRHRAHHDRKWYPVVTLFNGISYLGTTWPYPPMNLSNKLGVNTTNFASIDYPELIEFVKEH